MTGLLRRTGVLLSAEALTRKAGVLVTPRHVKIETLGEVFFRERKSRSPQWRLYIKPNGENSK